MIFQEFQLAASKRSDVNQGWNLPYVADREADFGVLLARAQALDYPAGLLIRVRYDRKLQANDTQLFTALSQTPALGEIVSAPL